MSDPTRFLRRRTRGTFLTSLFSISLVLFILSMIVAGGMLLNLTLKKVQEEFEMMVLVSNQTTGAKRSALEEKLAAYPFVKEIRFVSREEAAQEFVNAVGEDFMEIMDGINPMRASFNIKLRAEYIVRDSIDKINAALVEMPEIMEVEYPITEIEQIRNNMDNIYRGAAAVAIIVVIIAYFIISSTIRLAIFSKRLVIRSMQLIGATDRFIRRPFVMMGMAQGFGGALICSAMLTALLMIASRFLSTVEGLEELGSIQEVVFSSEYMLLIGGIIIFGSILGWLSSRMAVSRFLHKELDELI